MGVNLEPAGLSVCCSWRYRPGLKVTVNSSSAASHYVLCSFAKLEHLTDLRSFCAVCCCGKKLPSTWLQVFCLNKRQTPVESQQVRRITGLHKPDCTVQQSRALEPRQKLMSLPNFGKVLDLESMYFQKENDSKCCFSLKISRLLAPGGWPKS